MRKVAIVTGSRSEYGLLSRIIDHVFLDKSLELQLIVTGMHLSLEFGATFREIEKDGFPIAEKVEILLSSDTESAVATSMGLGMIGLAKAYERLKPDIIVVLGDRFEILSAVAAAVPFRIPVAHIHGGEVTEGSNDELFRHAITKMSHIHFPSTKVYADRINQMGESPEQVFCFGSPGLDNIKALRLLTKKTLLKKLGLPVEKDYGVVTYHPITNQKNISKMEIKELLSALKEVPAIFWIITMPNADPENSLITGEIEKFVTNHSDKACLIKSLGQIKYLSLMKVAKVMAGNSSSGIIEAASFELPVVNIGKRQKGRIRSGNVIDIQTPKKTKIINAIKLAISKEFKKSIKNLKNPYGNGNSSKKIVDVIKNIHLEKLMTKSFYEKNRSVKS